MATTSSTPFPTSSSDATGASSSTTSSSSPSSSSFGGGSSSGSGTSASSLGGAGNSTFPSSSSSSETSPSSTLTSTPSTRGEDLLNRVVQGAHQTIDRLAESAAPHVQRLQEGVSSAGDVLTTRADQVRETGDEWAESLRCTVRENPLAAVATALAVGLLIARVTR